MMNKKAKAARNRGGNRKIANTSPTLILARPRLINKHYQALRRQADTAMIRARAAGDNDRWVKHFLIWMAMGNAEQRSKITNCIKPRGTL